MGERSSIEWTTHTFNPWWGCTKVSPGCDHCYAEAFDRRLGGAHWGKDAPRRPASESYWRKPLAWNESARKRGVRERVFCASMADVFDADAPPGALARLWDTIRVTPALDWLLLTKRPGRIPRSLPKDWGEGWANVWLGTTVEDQQRAEQRVLWLLDTPARVRFLSVEPLLGPVDLTHIEMIAPEGNRPGAWLDALRGHVKGPDDMLGRRIDWVIAGSESGHGARPMHEDWVRSLRDQCQRAGVSFFYKQRTEGRRVVSLPMLDGQRWQEVPHAP